MIVANPSLQALQEAAQLLKSGALIAFPTETVYGLGADALNPSGVAQIFDLKGRPKDHPLIVHLASAQEVHHFALDIPAFATELMHHFWPGPLTLILKRKEGVGLDASGQQPTIGLRVPNHPLALDLLKEALNLGVMGIAAPSANRFGRVSPTQAQHVLDEFGESLFILDGGACDIGIESTIVDCTRGSPIILRPGQLLAKDIERFAPNELRLMSPEDLQNAQQSAPPANLALWTHRPLTPSALDPSSSNPPVWRAMPSSAQACAHELFATLRAFDGMGVSEIWIQLPPNEPEWQGVLDRLRRAAHA